MTSPAIKLRGQFKVSFPEGRETNLVASFENIALFEEQAKMGVYVFAHRIAEAKDIRLSDIVNMIWCFSYDRDTPGWTKDEIAETIMTAGPFGPQLAAVQVQGFLMMIFGLDRQNPAENMASAADAITKKKTVKS